MFSFAVFSHNDEFCKNNCPLLIKSSNTPAVNGARVLLVLLLKIILLTVFMLTCSLADVLSYCFINYKVSCAASVQTAHIDNSTKSIHSSFFAIMSVSFLTSLT